MVLVEETGRTVTPGPFLPTVIASAVLDGGGRRAQGRLLPGLADGSVAAAVALDADVTITGGTASGPAGVVLGGAMAQLLVIGVGDDSAVVEVDDAVTVEVPKDHDSPVRSHHARRRSGDGHPRRPTTGPVTAAALGRGRRHGERLHRDGRRVREGAGAVRPRHRDVPGRQAPLRQHGRRDRAGDLGGLGRGQGWEHRRRPAQLRTAVAELSAPAADLCANLSTQVHGDIAISAGSTTPTSSMRRCHDRCLTYLDADAAAADLVDLVRDGVDRGKQIELPPEAEPIRDEVRSKVRRGASPGCRGRSSATGDRDGDVMPHWPKPYGREARVEQLVIEQEFALRPSVPATASPCGRSHAHPSTR